MVNASFIVRQTMLWTARVISIMAAIFWLLILLDILACDALAGFACVNRDMLFLVIIVAVSAISVVLAWKNEIIGGIMMFIWGIIFSVFALSDKNTPGMISLLVSGIPFLIAGTLFLASWQLGVSNAEQR